MGDIDVGQLLGDSFDTLRLELRAQGLTQSVRNFSGEGSMSFKNWLADMDRAALLLNSDAEKMRQLALLSLKGPAAQQAAREIRANNQINWGQLRTAMRNRYSTLADEQYAVHHLKHLKQNDG